MRARLRTLSTLALLAVGPFFPRPAAAQGASVGGTVLNAETGIPLDGAQVTLERIGQPEARIGRVTGHDGRFLFPDVPAGEHRLSVVLIGFATGSQVVMVTAGQALTVEVRLVPEAIPLSEIIVTGTIGATQRTKLPFDVAQVRAAELPVPGNNAGLILQGKVAGVQVVARGGIPGASSSILLRGVTSLNASGRSQDPLYIVDDVILGETLLDLGTLDIQSIEVVKGAAAASLYGSRAANGVVHVRTRRGAEMANAQVRYSLRFEAGGSTLARRPGAWLSDAHHWAMTADGRRFLNEDGTACDWLDCTRLALAGQTARGGAATEWNTFQSNPWPGKTYDQVERLFTHGPFRRSHVNVEGRSTTSNFLVSASLVNQGGIVPYMRPFEQATFRANLDQSIQDGLSLGYSVFYSRATLPGEAQLEYGVVNGALGIPPVVDVFAEDPERPGELRFLVGPGGLVNPLYDVSVTDQELRRNRFLGSVAPHLTVLPWLTVDGNLSFDRSDIAFQQVVPKGYRTTEPSLYNEGAVTSTRTITEALNGSVTASARWQVGEGIRNRTQVRYLVERRDVESLEASGREFAVAEVPVLDNLDPETLEASSSEESIRADGYFLITNFDIRERYVVDALIRNDGSSLFGEDERRQWYYRLGGAWRLGQEAFFGVPHVEELKLRYSVGTAGGRPRFNAQYETFSVQTGRIVPDRLGNRNLKPEHSTEHEAGLDLSLFDRRTILSLTHARTTTENQILQVPVPTYTGYVSQWRNAGTLKSRTWEATLDLRLVERPSFTWSARVLFDATETEIAELYMPPFRYGAGYQNLYAREGEKVGTFYGVQVARNCSHLPAGTSCDGFAVNDDGFLVWIGPGGSFDKPNWGADGPLVRGRRLKWGTAFPGYCVDRVSGLQSEFCPLGNSIPDYNLGLSTTVSWRGLTVYALLSRSAGFQLRGPTFVRPGLMDQDDVPEARRKPLGYYLAWVDLSQGAANSTYLNDGTFTKLREMSLDYRLDAGVLRRIPGLRGITSVGLRITGQNLFTWSAYPGYDPEIGLTGGDTGSAVISRMGGFNYPSMRTFTGTVEVVF